MNRLLSSFCAALRGIVFCLVNERNMRIHTVVVAYVLLFFRYFTLTRGEIAFLFIAFGLVIGAEMLNSAIEGLTDMLAPKYSGSARNIKDIAAGAVLVFAHPTVYKSMPLVRQLAKEGVIDGIEVEHPRNSPEDRAECAALCEQYGLIHTGGTDFHGANHKVPHPVGTCTTADDQVARILELAHKRRGIDV